MSLDLNAMALFVKVLEYKRLSAASQCLDVAISTVSRKVSELEKILGVRLRERSVCRYHPVDSKCPIRVLVYTWTRFYSRG